MRKTQLISIAIVMIFFGSLSLSVYAINEEQNADQSNRLRLSHQPKEYCAACHGHHSGTPPQTQAEIDAQITIAVDQAVDAIITKYDPDKDGQIGLKEVIYYLQVISDSKN
ncbi:secreted protein [Candidatus Magnetomorum sp. HK-1]|nr:secreted protein [Candidatus Magnetomorum sp. HK-1]